MTNEFGEIIYAYTRADAVRDGEIVDVSEMAKEAGFQVPVGVTRAVWSVIEKKPPLQDVNGRLWDLLWMLRFRVFRGTRIGEPALFEVLMQSGRRKKWIFKAVLCAADPEGNPCVTIMLPDED